jgi:uncharacterized Zn finger protein (UPF0148 family)
MAADADKGEVFEVICPGCGATIWVDAVTREVVQMERKGEKKKDLDELLLKEKKKKEESDRKFEATAELEKKKREKAKEKFDKAFRDIDKTD